MYLLTQNIYKKYKIWYVNYTYIRAYIYYNDKILYYNLYNLVNELLTD